MRKAEKSANVGRRRREFREDVAMYAYKKGMCDADIAKYAGCASFQAYRWRHEKGLPANFRRGGSKRRLLYTVYNNRTDFPVIVDGTKQEAIKAMGVSPKSFDGTISKARKGENRKWTVLTRKMFSDDEEV